LFCGCLIKGKRKKESGDSFVNVYLMLQLICLLLLASCCCRLYLLQISGMSFILTYPCRLCLLRVLLDACPFSVLQCMALPACCNCSPCLLTVDVGKCPSPLSSGVSSHQSLLEAFPSPRTLGEVAPHPPSPAGLFIYSSRGEVPLPHSPAEGATQGTTPPPFSRAQGTPPSLLLVLFFQLLIIQGFFLGGGGGQSVQGAMLIFLRGGCGRTTCHLFAHLLVCVSQAS
jgi:hypothetical protein